MGVIENSLMSFRGQKENVSIEENSSSDPWLYGWKVPKTNQDIQLNLLKFDCQNLPVRGSLASSKLNPFLFPQELKFNLKTISKTMQ